MPNFSILFLALLFLGTCRKGNDNNNKEALQQDLETEYAGDLTPSLESAFDNRLTSFASLPGGRSPLQIYMRQLVDRAAEEQIVVTRNPERKNLELFLISPRVISSVEGSVADYRIVAQEELSIELDTFTLQTQDLTGDVVTQEIFITGKDNAGTLHAYVFQLLSSGDGKNVVGLRRIFYQSDSEGSYEISFDNKNYHIVHQRVTDREGYQLELTDLEWNSSARAFVVRNVQTIDNSNSVSDTLKSVYSGKAEDFFAAIDGLWVQQGNQVFLYFDAQEKALLVYGDAIGLETNDQIIEEYSVVSMVKGLWNRLNLNVRNKYVYNIQNYFYVTLEDIETIQFFALDDTSYGGTYKRVNKQNYQNYLDENFLSVREAPFQLEGVFHERVRGGKYIFQADQLTLNREDATFWTGAYSLFSFRDKVYLEMHLIEKTSYKELRKTYRLESSADPSAEGVTIVLYPVRLLNVEEANNIEDILRLERETNINENELEDLLPGS